MSSAEKDPHTDWPPIHAGAPITEPVVAVPADFLGTDAEAIALAVAGAVAAIALERDDVRRELEAAADALEALVAAYPETGWAHATAAKEDAQALLARLRPPPEPKP
jgi:hypothetical protein